MDNLSIPCFDEINSHYEGVGSSLRTQNPLFHLAKLEDLDSEVTIKMRPYRNNFFEIIYGRNVEKLAYRINDHQFQPHPQFLLFSAPYQVHSWEKADVWEGYVLSFKGDFLKPFVQANVVSLFPFFSIIESNFLKLDLANISLLDTYFDRIFEEQENYQIKTEEIIKANLIALLNFCARLYDQPAYDSKHSTKSYEIVANYQYLVNEHFKEQHQVKSYADLLSITSNHLTQVVMQVTGKSAKSFIIDRLMLEARYILAYTGQDVAEIAYLLNFSNPTHFGQFFKKQQGLTPAQFRATKRES